VGTIVAQAIINRAATAILNDPNKVRFKQADQLAFLCEGQRLIASVRPDAYSADTTITLAAGVKQALPATAHVMLRPRYNLAGGTTPSRMITAVSLESLDYIDPAWRAGVQKDTVKHVVYDPQNPASFDVYPPVVNGTKIVALLGLVPADIVIGATILLDDTFEAPLFNYVMARNYEKDAEYAGNPARVQAYYALMQSQLGMQAQSFAASNAEETAEDK
jgi:hypothetical protein